MGLRVKGLGFKGLGFKGLVFRVSNMGKWSIAEVSRGKHGLLRTESSNIRTPQGYYWHLYPKPQTTYQYRAPYYDFLIEVFKKVGYLGLRISFYSSRIS